MLQMKRWSALATGSGVGAAVLAKLACPMCYPAAAGLISSMGLGAAASETFLNALSAILIPAALFGLGFRARERRGYRPLLLGFVSVVAGTVGSVSGINSLFFFGIGGLIGASIWNLIPKRFCTSCAKGQERYNNKAQV